MYAPAKAMTNTQIQDIIYREVEWVTPNNISNQFGIMATIFPPSSSPIVIVVVDRKIGLKHFENSIIIEYCPNNHNYSCITKNFERQCLTLLTVNDALCDGRKADIFC